MKETLIECNKQREKSRSQKANEITKLKEIKAKRAEKALEEGRRKAAFVTNAILAERRSQQNSADSVSGNDKPASTFHHSEPSPTTELGNIATVIDRRVTDEPTQLTRSELSAQINHLQDIRAIKAAKQLQESQTKAEEEAKRKEDDEAKLIEKSKRALKKACSKKQRRMENGSRGSVLLFPCTYVFVK